MLRADLARLRFSIFQQHPQPQLRVLWSVVQASFLVLPFSPFIGGVALLLTGMTLCARYGKRLLQQPLIWGWLGLSLWLVIAASFALDTEAAFLGLYNFIPQFVVFVGLSCLIQGPRQLRHLAWLIVLSTIPIVVAGLGQLLGGWGGHPQWLGLVVDIPINPGGNPPGRMASVFQYANILASYLLVPWVLGLGLWIEALDQVWQSWRSRSPQKPIAPSSLIRLLVLTIVLLGILAALILTSSRNAWVISALACLAFAVYRGWHWLLVVMGAVVSTLVTAAIGPEPLRSGLRHWVPAYFWARLSDEMYPNRPVAELRRTQWQFAWSLTEQRPWTGWGLRSFTSLYEAQMNFWLGHPHNLWLMLSSETGIPATLLFLGLVGVVLWRGVLLLLNWRSTFETNDLHPANPVIFLSYLLAFLACTLFHTVDITLFDIRVNLIGWLPLAAIYGVVSHSALKKSNPGT